MPHEPAHGEPSRAPALAILSGTHEAPGRGALLALRHGGDPFLLAIENKRARGVRAMITSRSSRVPSSRTGSKAGPTGSNRVYPGTRRARSPVREKPLSWHPSNRQRGHGWPSSMTWTRLGRGRSGSRRGDLAEIVHGFVGHAARPVEWALHGPVASTWCAAAWQAHQARFQTGSNKVLPGMHPAGHSSNQGLSGFLPKCPRQRSTGK